jgi:hypothetical protein
MITKLGFTCFRVVGDVAVVQLRNTRATMGAFLRPRRSARARFQMRVTTMDRIIRETLALSA